MSSAHTPGSPIHSAQWDYLHSIITLLNSTSCRAFGACVGFHCSSRLCNENSTLRRFMLRRAFFLPQLLRLQHGRRDPQAQLLLPRGRFLPCAPNGGFLLAACGRHAAFRPAIPMERETGLFKITKQNRAMVIDFNNKQVKVVFIPKSFSPQQMCQADIFRNMLKIVFC